MGIIDGKVCVVTGSNSGIGRETAKALASMGAYVVMVTRSKERGTEAREAIIKETGNREVDLLICDLSIMSEVESLAEVITENYRHLDLLINNAGAVFSKRKVTPEGFENTFAVNYLAPFKLTHQLVPLLKYSAPSRVVNLSSGLYRRAHVNLEDLQSTKNYEGMKAYQNSKLMVLLFTYELARRLTGTGVTVNAVQPGFVATNLGRNTGSLISSIMFRLVRPLQLSPKEGAQTSIYAATSPELEGVTGRCFAKSSEVETSPESYDEDLQRRLYEKTLSLLNIEGVETM